LLAKLYGRDAIPFQTLNFPIGTQQLTHSDTIHFNSVPERYTCAVWIALEDVDEDNGPLHYYPGSHKLPIYSALDIGFIGNKKMIKENYKNYYEPFIKNLVKSHDLKKELAILKKGTAFIWAANLLHGGDRIKDPNRSRHSQVTHYCFRDCYYYQPLSSMPELNSVYHRTVYDISKECFVAPKVLGKSIKVPFYRKIKAYIRETIGFTPYGSLAANKCTED
jgi:ectoine hydroxylase-related dioxygenase (phytanoyl-CoA dioxygenase family)